VNRENYIQLLDDLRVESDRLTECLAALNFEQWGLVTPARGWALQDQVTHLAYFDDCARQALTNPDEFCALVDRLVGGGMDFPDRIAEDHRLLGTDTMFSWFTNARRALLDTLVDQDPRRRVPWFGPHMSVASSATARLMETWAHGHDIYDALGIDHPPSPGLRSIAHLGVSTFAFSHKIHGVEVPDDAVRVELRAPTGELWSWGPADAVNRVQGGAEDFVLTVTQRRNWTETALSAQGPVATQWLDIAQAFAGAATRRPVAQ
jgi:uncharacterized protein (TIGR03084 family)